MKKSLADKINFNNNMINIIVLLIISIILFKPLISSKYVWGHDSFYHYSNIFALYKNNNPFLFNLFPNKIIPIIAYDFGWGSGIFYPCIPEYSVLYLYRIVYNFGITNIFTSMKIVHFMIFFLSGITMYMLSLKIFKNKQSALISSILYLTFPYYYIDIFVRDAINECFMFAFIPLVFLGIEYLFEWEQKKFYLYFIIGYFFCINCHLVLCIYLTFFVMMYLLLNIKKVLNIKKIKSLFIASIIILGLSSFYLVPLIMHTVDSNYVVYLKDLMCNYSTIIGSTVKIKDYFNFSKPKSWTGIVLSTTSIPCLIAFLVSVFYLKKSIIRKKILCFVSLIIINIFVMTPFFPWKYMPRFLWNIQFVWRLNTFLLFFMSLVGGMFIKYLKSIKIKNIITVLLIIFSIVYISTFKEMLVLENFDIDSFDISKTGAAFFQYIPIKAYKNMDYIENRGNEIIITDGQAKITNAYSKTPYLSFSVKTDGAKLELPRYYFKIYDIISNGEKIRYKESNMGFIEININEDSDIVVKESSKLDIILIIIFITSFVVLLYLLLKKGTVDKNEEENM